MLREVPNRECGSNYNFLRQHQSHRHGPLRDTNCCEIDTAQAGNAVTPTCTTTRRKLLRQPRLQAGNTAFSNTEI
ncbi:hypothetical protein L917_21639 [Phytophthora nicotianae]|uniref:Uncharacterized protein n=1 Tax=Phytophthora nicotianae TaxID=4792 RepID=W2JX16_PHYNI|nr:hypothetical protein L917_21639 [Phytophthora nicotianae]